MLTKTYFLTRHLHTNDGHYELQESGQTIEAFHVFLMEKNIHIPGEFASNEEAIEKFQEDTNDFIEGTNGIDMAVNGFKRAIESFGDRMFTLEGDIAAIRRDISLILEILQRAPSSSCEFLD